MGRTAYRGIGLVALLFVGCQALSGIGDLETVGAGSTSSSSGASASSGSAGSAGSAGGDIDAASDGSDDGAASSSTSSGITDAATDATDGRADASDAATDANDGGDAGCVLTGPTNVTLSIAITKVNAGALASVRVGCATVCTGAACTGTLNVPVASGATVTITATPAMSNDAHFTDRTTCVGTAPCTAMLTGNTSVKLQVTDANYIFATKSKHDGNLGGRDGADAMCANAAAGAGLPGVYKAFLSVAGFPAPDRFLTARGWTNTVGEPFTDTMRAGTGVTLGRVFHPVSRDELGTLLPSVESDWVFTGTTEDGNITAGQTCNDWTSNATNVVGTFGLAYAGSRTWTYRHFNAYDPVAGVDRASCPQQGRVYCLGTTRNAPVTIPARPMPSRRAFISKASLAGNAGVPLFDSACQAEGGGAGFHALLSQSTVAAPDRVALWKSAARGDWYRPDGMLALRVADLGDALAVPSVPFTQYADGTYLTNDFGSAWTGIYGSFTGAANTATNCNNWTTGGGNGAWGDATLLARVHFDGLGPVGLQQTACATTFHVYCLED